MGGVLLLVSRTFEENDPLAKQAGSKTGIVDANVTQLCKCAIDFFHLFFRLLHNHPLQHSLLFKGVKFDTFKSGLCQ
jgi:hypothetical protein